jgi:GT2 family glycosyltransferase
MTPDIAVVVPTYSRPASVVRLLDALSRQTLDPGRYEVVVAIDGSRDGTTELVERFTAPYRLTSVWQENAGRAAACNAGILQSEARIVAIIDDDMEPSSECLDMHLAAHAGDDAVCVLGAVPIELEPGAPPLAHYFRAKFDDHLRHLADPRHRFVARDFFTGNTSVPRALLNAAGLFDEDFRLYGNEDLDLGLRLRAAGARFLFEPRAVAAQRFDKDFARAARDAEEKGRTAVVLLAKHPHALPELRLATYAHAPWPWRTVRRALLAAGARREVVPSLIRAFTAVLERSGARRLRLYYDLVLDYFYWLGVEKSVREFPLADDTASTRLLLHR